MAATLLFRHLRPHFELSNIMQDVQFMSDPQAIEFYKSIIEDITTIRDLIKDGDLSESDCETVEPILKKFAKSCCEEQGHKILKKN